MGRKFTIGFVFIFCIFLVSGSSIGDFWDVITGHVIEVDCTDSDAAERSHGGSDLFIKGVVEDFNGTYEDYCKVISGAVDDIYQVVEYACIDNKKAEFVYTCEKSCSDGHCLFCEDSDSGFEYDVKGTVLYDSGELEDVCVDENTLKEYICANFKTGEFGERIVDCPNGCIDGACVFSEESCEDSDGGNDLFVKGNLRSVSELGEEDLAEDECIYPWNDIEVRYLYEYYCENNRKVHNLAECPEGYGCKDGSCIELSDGEFFENPYAVDCVKDGGVCLLPEGGCGIYEKMDSTCDNGDSDYDEMICCSGHRNCGDGICDKWDMENCPGDCDESEVEDTLTESNNETLVDLDTDRVPIQEIVSDMDEPLEVLIEEKCDACLIEDDICVPFGFRVDGQYCDLTKVFVSQLESDLECDNNFECKSNLCIDSECISEGFLKKVLNWFSKLFG